MTVRPNRPLIVRAVCAALALSVLAACGSTSAKTPHPSAPLTLDNCGTKVEIDSAPERVVTIKSTSTEMMLALGLGDRIVGQAFADGPVPERWAKAAEGVPTISEQVPSREALLDLDPDLIYAGWESNVSAEGAGDRGQWHALGVQTYVSPAACQDTPYQPEPMTFDELFDEIAQVGAIFDVQDAAESLIAEQRAALAGVDALDPGTTALWYSSGDATPYVGAGIGTPQMIMDALGLENVAGDIDKAWSSLGWEAIVDADPDVIILVDATWNPAELKIAHLESNPATRRLRAVRESRYLTIDFASSEAGVRTVPATVDLAEQLRRLEVSDQ